MEKQERGNGRANTNSPANIPASTPNNSDAWRQPFRAPAIDLPKGGGAIRGIGEKFAANPVTGTGSITIPIATSASRSGFGPQLSLSYDSGAGNSAFGLGWALSLPVITRKTDKGLPRYQDANESDVFILSGTEDLVPVGEAENDSANEFSVRRYCPRVEGIFARIERWTHRSDPKNVFWRCISRDNITTLYGKTIESRLADPADESNIFSWLVCESYDDKGNAIRYEYKAENAANIDLSNGNERNRSRSAQRYLKRIKYGNKTPHSRAADLAQHPDEDWMFEVVFDYGEHYDENGVTTDGVATDDRSQPTAIRISDELRNWAVRKDPFSSYRSGFELRTYRLCQRVLMFHHFAELGATDYLVRATHFQYRSSANVSFITAVTQSSYVLQGNTYLKKSLPPVEFEYSEARIDETVHDVNTDSLDNLPYGIGSLYRWVDLDGEGLAGVLSEQDGAWFYKRNLSAIPLNRPNEQSLYAARFAPLERLPSMPSFANLSGGQQLLDLDSNGQLDVVEFDGPAPGFFERTFNEDWKTLIPFASLPNVEWNDPNLRFIDLTGNGHADILISEDDIFTWYPSLAKEGFGRAKTVRQSLDEEAGPRLVFADDAQSIYLSDLSGDGLTDLVRIRNGDVSYWPNLGYGRFGKKIAMDNAPWFDAPDQFDQQRIRLADIDGSGTVDILYLGRAGVQLYFNQAGNSWSSARKLNHFPHIDNLSSVMAIDLLGNGTACLAWSSPLPSNARRPMRYIDLVGGQKPHLLIKIRNNLGAETEVQYAPSTKFYLQDRAAGRPWITKLPFPVHVVERTTITDKWRNTKFSSTYSYHHGYFDGIEREFRGFGRVEQTDVENFQQFLAGNKHSAYITDDLTLYQPPIKTITWFHTGAAVDRERILTQFQHEYFPNALAARATTVQIDNVFTEKMLPEPELDIPNLSAEEWREALRACKGTMLRQEIYELKVDPLLSVDAATPDEVPVRLFSAATRNCNIRRLQPKGANRHAVFAVTESESVSYHYELDLQAAQPLKPDPRVSHTLNLKFDELGNVQQSIAVGYPRLRLFVDTNLTAHTDLIREVQRELHVAYNESHYTNDVVDPPAGAATLQEYRLRAPCEVQTYELSGFVPTQGRYFDLNYFRSFKLSETLQPQGTIPVLRKLYHELPQNAAATMRLVEHARTLFFDDNTTGPNAATRFLKLPLPLGILGRLGLPYEQYKLALTESLLNAVFTGERLDQNLSAVGSPRQMLNNWRASGYLSGSDADALFGVSTAGEYWMRSGVAGFSPDAALHFYLPESYVDPFDNKTTLAYGDYDLFVRSSSDALGNTVTVEQFDYRVLAPRETRDSNDNYTAVAFDALGMPVASAVMGKLRTESGDNLNGLQLNLPVDEVENFFIAAYDNAVPTEWLANATARYVYDFGTHLTADGTIVYAARPASACGIVRETHAQATATTKIQVAVEYSDGLGSVLVKKVQAEPAPNSTANAPQRWIASGKTILNNKGKPVKQYEPYFSSSEHRMQEPQEEGVTSITYYDAAGRAMRNELPDGTYTRIEFSPWHATTFDQNDTVLETGNAWFARHNAITASAEERRAAQQSAEHANTPAYSFLDSLGREVIGVAHNRVKDAEGTLHDERYLTFMKLDAEGKPLWIRDTRGNLVMQYITPPAPNGQASDPAIGFIPCYDIAGNLLFQHSMDAGDRWMLNDAAGQPLFGWDSRGCVRRTTYDALRRPIGLFAIENGNERLAERAVYGETQGAASNHRTRAYQMFDSAGIATSIAYDFKGNLLQSRRELLPDYKDTVDWQQDPTPSDGTFTSSTSYDALNRPVMVTAPDGSVYRPTFNEANLLDKVDINLRGAMFSTPFVTGIHYNAKRQRESIEYGNGVRTHYEYDAKTLRLTHLQTLRGATRLQDLFYTHDAVGNIIQISDEAQQTTYFNNQVVEPHNSYTYDALYRLVEATGREHIGQTPVGDSSFKPHYDSDDSSRSGSAHPNDGQAMRNYQERFEYDGVGNILKWVHDTNAGSWTRDHVFAGDSNRLLQTRLPGNIFASYDYDSHGNMIRMPHLALMQWNFKDQLQATSRQVVNVGTPETTYYVYDSGGQRVRKVTERQAAATQTPTRSSERIYLGGFEIYREFNSDGSSVSLERETLHIMDDNQRIALAETRTKGDDDSSAQLIRYQFGNHLGSASLELDDQAQIISYEEYTPYGSTSYHAVRSQTETAKRYRYTAMERDEESGLSYHGARYYATWLGRWTACDPTGLRDGLNLYQYVSNDPISRYDKSGTEGKRPQGVSVSPSSTVTADEWVKMIRSSNELKPWIREMFISKDNRILIDPRALTSKGEIKPPDDGNESDIPAWLRSVVIAVNSGKWHVTTATIQTSAIKADGTSDPQAIGNVFRPDFEDGDQWIQGNAGNQTTSELFGYTLATKTLNPQTDPCAGFGCIRRLRMSDDPNGEKGTRREGKSPPKGLVIVATRYSTAANNLFISRSDESKVETFLHELAAHAGLITKGEFTESQHVDYIDGSVADKYSRALKNVFPDNKSSDENARNFAKIFKTPQEQLAEILAQLSIQAANLKDLAQKRLQQLKSGK